MYCERTFVKSIMRDESDGATEENDKDFRPKSVKSLEDAAARKIRLEREAAQLQASLRDGVMSDVRTKVAWILNMFPHTRNSDISLTLKYWELFQADIFNPIAMNPRDLFKLERETNIVRVRAKIQNEYQLFPADEHVRRRRRELQEDVSEAVVEDKPERNVVLVFADETGKTAEFVCVAAVWVLTGYTLFRLTQAIRAWQDTSPWANTEIHFTKFRNSQVIALGEYLDIVRKHREFLSFKVIGVEKSTTKRPIEEVVMKLHEYMLIHGAAHEVDNKRIKLPHEIRLTVDAEQSLDAIACADMKGHIASAYKTAYGDDLTIEDVSAVSSHKSQLVQLADVIAGAVNRRKNNKGERNHKDEMADMVITQLDIQLEREDVPDVDASTWLQV
jgi:hypothetical protein